MYKVNIYKLDKPVGSARANVTVSFNDELCVRGLSICECNSGTLSVRLPVKDIRNKINTIGEYGKRLVFSPIGDFSKTFFRNLIDMYVQGINEKTFEGVEPLIETQMHYVGKGNVHSIANVVLDNKFVINGFKLVNGKNGFFISNPSEPVLSEPAQDVTYRDLAFPMSKAFREELTEQLIYASEMADPMYRNEMEKIEGDINSTIEKIDDMKKNRELFLLELSESSKDSKSYMEKSEDLFLQIGVSTWLIDEKEKELDELNKSLNEIKKQSKGGKVL